jgi:TonB family protein
MAAPSIGGSLRRLEERLALGSGLPGTRTGTGQQIGDLFFDPQGADFTAWANHFRTEVYRNWIVPQIAMVEGDVHVDISMVVRRDGSIERLAIVKGTGNAPLDRAAANALLSARLRPLPDDYRPDRLPLEVSFHYRVARRS